jgi:hypothetical protein
MSTHRADEIVQGLKVVVIPRHADAILLDGMPKMIGITASGPPRLGW